MEIDNKYDNLRSHTRIQYKNYTFIDINNVDTQILKYKIMQTPKLVKLIEACCSLSLLINCAHETPNEASSIAISTQHLLPPSANTEIR